MKFYESTISDKTNYTSVGVYDAAKTFYPFDGITPGDGESNRTGKQILVHSINFHTVIAVRVDPVSPEPFPLGFKFIKGLIKDAPIQSLDGSIVTQVGPIDLYDEDISADFPTMLFRKMHSRENFKVLNHRSLERLWVKRWENSTDGKVYQSPTSTGNGTVHWIRHRWLWRPKPPMKVQWQEWPDSGGDSVVKNKLFVFLMTRAPDVATNGVSTVNWGSAFRILFTDA